MSGMQMDEGDSRLLEPVTEQMIGCAFTVANALGQGFVEIRSVPAMPKRLAGDRHAPVPADQLRPVHSRNAAHHGASLIGRTITFIAAYPA
jgi:hypothetical protein